MKGPEMYLAIWQRRRLTRRNIAKAENVCVWLENQKEILNREDIKHFIVEEEACVAAKGV